MMFYPLKALVTIVLLAYGSFAFSVDKISTPAKAVADAEQCLRRSFLLGGAAAVVAGVTAAATGVAPANAALGAGTVVGREIDTFSSLIYNFRNIDLGGGLDASTLSEPSVPFVEFGEKMKNGEVTLVEFMAPSGDVAYATFKGKTEKIRIGEGYPINKKGSWSSPDYVIRSVSNFGVPYKFTVPALAKFSTKK